VNPRSSKLPKNSISVETFKGSKSKNCHPNPSRYQKLNNLLKLLKNPREKKKKKKGGSKCSKLPKNWTSTEDFEESNSRKLPPKSFKLPKTQQSAQASFSFFLFWKNPTMIQPCAPKILQATQNLNWSFLVIITIDRQTQQLTPKKQQS